MTDQFLTEEIASDGATITETIEIPRGGELEEYKIEVKEASVKRIKEFEEREKQGADEIELFDEIFDEYLVKPSGLDAESLGGRTLDAIARGIFRAWGASDGEIEQALEDRAGN